jgi:ABC-type amino acid transport substrate-binding protein
MKSRLVTICVVVLSVVSVLDAWLILRKNEARPGNPQTAVMERVSHSGELRVGYLIEPPYLSKGGSPDGVSGIFYDVMQTMGEHLGLRVRWVEEVSLATLATGLDTGRYDMIAFSLWRNAGRAKNVAFSTPLFYSTLGIYVRANDNRFDQNRQAINNHGIRVASMDGELAGEIARNEFPLATVSALPQLSDYSQMLLEVVSGKADVTFFNRVLGSRFMRQNPGQLRDISGSTPIRVYAECFLLPLRDPAFKSMIDASLLEMIENGDIDRAFRKNGENPDEYYRPIVPYRPPTEVQ